MVQVCPKAPAWRDRNTTKTGKSSKNRIPLSLSEEEEEEEEEGKKRESLSRKEGARKRRRAKVSMEDETHLAI
jgi:hypothetical protein